MRELRGLSVSIVLQNRCPMSLGMLALHVTCAALWAPREDAALHSALRY